MAQYWATILNDTPYSYYRLGEFFGTTARDDGTAGKAYDGAITGGPILSQTGAITGDPNTAIRFNGSSEYVLCPLAGVAGTSFTTISVECWFYLAVSPTGFWRVAACADTINDNKGFELLVNSGGTGVQFHVGNGSSHASATKSISLSTGTWYHLVGTWDGFSSHTAQVYINAVAGTSASLSGTMGTPTHGLGIAYNPAYNGDYFNGIIDEVAIYGSVLSQAQITNHYNVGLNSTTGPWTMTVSRVPMKIQAGSLVVDLAISRTSTASVVGKTASGVVIQQYQPVAIYDQNAALYFSGYVSTSPGRKPGFQGSLLWSIACVDQHWLADKRLVFDTGTTLAKIYAGKGYDFIVQDILTNILAAEGVTLGSMYGLAPSATLPPNTTLAPLGPAVVIPLATLNYPTVAQVFDALAKASAASGVTFYWYIDQWKRLFFQVDTAVTGATVDGTQVDDGTLSHRPPTITNANPLYFNTQYVAGGTNNGLSTQNVFNADASQTSWTLSYPVAGGRTPPAIYLNGTLQSVGVLNVDTGKAYYYSIGSNTITAGTNPQAGLLLVNYWAQQDATATYVNSTEVTNQAAIDGTSGIIESVVKDVNMTSLTDGIAEAQANVTRNGQRGKQFVFTTRSTGFLPGQMLTCTYAPFSLSAAQMLVENVHMDDSADQYNIWYTVSAVSGPFDSTWVNFFGGALNTPPPQSAQSITIGV